MLFLFVHTCSGRNLNLRMETRCLSRLERVQLYIYVYMCSFVYIYTIQYTVHIRKPGYTVFRCLSSNQARLLCGDTYFYFWNSVCTLYSCKSNFSIRVSTIIGLAYRLASLSQRFRSFNFTGHEANVYIRILFESISCASELHLYTYCTQCSTVYEI